MSSERDFDRIARAWLDLGPNEAPDRAIAAVLQATETTPQVRRPIRWPAWRPFTMTRITTLAVLAGTIVIVIGGLLLSGGGSGPAPTVAPSSLPTASAAAVAPSPGPLPTDIWGGWTAASRGTDIEDEASSTLLFGPSSLDQWNPGLGLERQSGPRLLGSTVIEETPGVLRMTLNTPGMVSCEMRDVGTYRWSKSTDGQWLTLERIDDACPIRGEIVDGTWQRNLGYTNDGGAGIAVNFRPFVALTLPDEHWTGNQFGETDTLALDNEDGTADLRLWKDPDGFVDACDRGAGHRDLDPGIDAFLAYLRDGRQFTVIDETELTVDGRRAVEVEIRLGDAIEGPCAPLDGNESDRSGILLWASHAAGTFWNGVAGDQWSLVVTEAGGATFVMEIVRQDGATWPVDRAVLDSIRFLDALPAPPAS